MNSSQKQSSTPYPSVVAGAGNAGAIVLAKEPLISQTFPSQDEAYWSNRKDTLPPEIVLSLPLSELNTQALTSEFYSPPITSAPSSTSNGTSSGRTNTDTSPPSAKRSPLNGSATSYEVAGDHYRKHKIQPVEYIVANGIGFLAANVIKYATRYKDKNGAEDIRKAIHYLNLILEFEYGE